MASYIESTCIRYLDDMYYEKGVWCDDDIICNGCGEMSNEGYYKCLDCYNKDVCEICILGSDNSGITKCLESHHFSGKQVINKTIGENQFRILKEYEDDRSSQDIIAIDQDNKLYLSTNDDHGRVGVYSVPDNYTFEQLKALVEEKEIYDTPGAWDAFYNTRVKRTMSEFGMQIHYG